jgi:hypothetical protein
MDHMFGRGERFTDCFDASVPLWPKRGLLRSARDVVHWLPHSRLVERDRRDSGGSSG